MAKKLLLTCLMLGLLFVTSGCYKLKSDIALSADSNTVNGTVRVTVPTKFFTQMDGQFPTEDLPAAVTVQSVSAPGAKGYAYTLKNMPVEELGAGNSPLPFSIETTADAYVLVGDFRNFFPTAKSLKQDGISVKGKVPAPAIDFKFAFPDPITDAPKGLKTEGNVAKISGPWVAKNKQFRIAAAHNFNAPSVRNFEDFPTSNAETPDGYPLPSRPRNMIPFYFFAAMIAMGTVAAIGGRYANLGGREPKAKKAKK